MRYTAAKMAAVPVSLFVVIQFAFGLNQLLLETSGTLLMKPQLVPDNNWFCFVVGYFTLDSGAGYSFHFPLQKDRRRISNLNYKCVGLRDHVA